MYVCMYVHIYDVHNTGIKNLFESSLPYNVVMCLAVNLAMQHTDRLEAYCCVLRHNATPKHCVIL